MSAPIFIAGPASWNQLVGLDRLPEPVPHMQFATGEFFAIGGTSAGKALNLRSLGLDVVLRTVLGSDPAGTQIFSGLTEAGVTVIVEASASGLSERHLNLMDPSGGRVSLYLSLPEVPRDLLMAPEASAALAASPVAVVDLSDQARPFLAEARAAGVPIWTDIHDYDGSSEFHRDFVEAASVIFMNGDGLGDGVRDFLQFLYEDGIELAVCTLGADGAVAIDSTGEWFEVAAVPVDEIVDTNGAGDAFFAGVLAARLSGLTVADALAAGAAQASRAITVKALAPPADAPPTVV